MLGRDLVEILRPSFPEVIGWDLDEIDIRQEKETALKIEGLRPEIVINVAAYTDVDGCELEREKAFAVNAEGMRHVALGALRCGAKAVYLSTDYVFDGEKGEPYVENDPPHPLNVYGHSKLKGEQYLQELMDDILIVRTQWLYGRQGKNFIASVLRQAKEKGVLSIVDDQIGSPTYTVDLSKALSALIWQNARGIFHAGNSDSCSWYVFGQAILKLSEMEGVKVIPISSKELNRRAVRPLRSVLDCRKLEKVTGMALRPWSEGLKDYLSMIGFEK
jgi:dTDP-4-dehydrorhamnose reductase